MRLGIRATADPDGESSLLLFEVGVPDGSWAACDYKPGAGEFAVTWHGSRNLWAETEAAYLRWASRGSPGIDRLGVTITAGTRALWIDDPGRAIIAA